MSDPESTGQDAPATSEAQNPAATTDTVETLKAGTDPVEGEESQAAKTFTQAELDTIVQKEKAKAEAKAERRVMKTLEKIVPQREQQTYQQPADARPSREQFTNDADYIDKLTDWKLDQRDKQANQSKAIEQTRSVNNQTEKLYAEAAKQPGFDRDEFDALPLTPAIAHALMDSEVAPRLMAHLLANADEVERIVALSPGRQAVEMGKIEARLQSAPKTTNAPAPINPIGSKGTANPSLENASLEDYMRIRKSQGASWAR